MCKFLVLVLIFIFFRFYLCLKLQNIYKERYFSISRKIKRINVDKKTFLYKYGIYNKSDLRKQNYKLHYKSKKERDILESGYLYPFDHLEKKKKKFPPDPYVPSEEENEDSYDIFDEKLDDDYDYLRDDDNDAKKYFGKTTFNQPNILEEHEKEKEKNSPEIEKYDDTNYENSDDLKNEKYYNSRKENSLHNLDQDRKKKNLDSVKKHSIEINEIKEKEEKDIIILHNEENDKNNVEKEIINIDFYSSEINKIECEMMKDRLYYLFHSCMDNTFIESFQLNIESFINSKEKGISVFYKSKTNNIKVAISSLNDLINFYYRLKKILCDKIDKLHKNEEDENIRYINKSLRKEIERNKKERGITNLSKKNLQMSTESSLKLIEKCTQNMYKQNYEMTLHDLKLAYNMLPCKYYGYFLSNLCSNISILSFYTNDIQGAFYFALKSIKYEPKYCIAWKCLGDAYRSFRKFWQAKNFYDIAIYLGYKDNKGENFDEITQSLNDLTKNALKNVDSLKENMNNHLNVVVKKNIGIVINKNPDSIGGCYVSYIIEGSKANKKNFKHGDQIVALNNIVTYGKPIDFCLKSFQKNDGSYDIVFFKGNIVELYGLKAYKYLIKNNLFSTLFENEKILSFKRDESILFDMKGFGTFSEYGISKSET